MTIRTHNGQWLVAGAGIATADDCCCDDPPPPPGCCCAGGAIDSQYTDQASCEDCTTTYTCTEELLLDDPEDECPEGYSGSDGYCTRVTSPDSCEDCDGFCDETQSGACNTWIVGDCLALPNCTGVASLEICGFPCEITTPLGLRETIPCSGNFLPIPLAKVSAVSFSYSIAAAFATLSIECGRWRFNYQDSSGNTAFIVNSSVSMDMGPVVPGECAPAGGTGTLYWTTTDGNAPPQAFASGSVSISLTIC